MTASRRYPASLDRIRAEPEALDQEMTPGDIAAVLRRLKFAGGRPETVKLIDSETRDYLVAAVTRQAERPR
jgi:hypothetical protein